MTSEMRDTTWREDDHDEGEKNLARGNRWDCCI
jgi:hypothetical protein